jgi:hypothetical protein
MTDKEKVKILSNCFEEVIWMAIRYADGRHTFAPYTVREAIKDYQKVNPEWKPKHDRTIEKPTEDMLDGFSLASDYLWDLFKNKENESER